MKLRRSKLEHRPLVRTALAATAITAIATGASLTASTITARPAHAATLSVNRIAGPDRYGTAAAIARQAHPQGVTTVLIASGETFPDALAASALAGSLGAPILLTPAQNPPSSVRDALAALRPSEVIVVGGTNRVSDATASALASAAGGAGVQRIAGADRYATAALIAAQVPAASIPEVNGARTAFLATGEKFPDALAAGAVAASLKAPLLLSAPGTLPAATASALTAAGINQVVLLGGETTLAPEVEAALAAAGVSSTRLGGTDRQATAAMVADWAVQNAAFDPAHVAVVRGEDAGGGADALALGPLAATRHEPILLTASPSDAGKPTLSWIDAHAATLNALDVTGSEAAVSAAAVDAVRQAASGAAPAVSGNGSLAVTVADVPAGGSPLVSVSGPGGYYRTLSATATLTGLPAGTYRLVANPAPYPGGTAHAAAPEVSVDVPAGGAASTVVDYASLIPSDTVVAAPAAVTAVTGSNTGAQQVVTLNSAIAPAVQVGDVLMTSTTPANPVGVIGRVQAAGPEGPAQSVSVTPLDITEALPAAQIDVSQTVTLPEGDVNASAAGVSEAPSSSPAAVGLTGGTEDGAARKLAAAAPGKINWVPTCTGAGTPKVEAEKEFNPKVAAKVHWNVLTGDKSADFSVGVDAKLGISASYNAKGNCSFQQYVPIGSLTPIPFSVGVFSGFLVPRVGFNMAFDATVTESASCEASTSASLTYGRHWDGHTWQNYGEADVKDVASCTAPSAVGTISASAGPQVDLLLDGLVGPTFTLGVDAKATLQNSDPIWALEGHLKAQVGVSDALKIFHVPTATVWEKSREMARAAPGDGGGTDPGPVTPTGVCSGVSDCREAPSSDVDGDGRPDGIGIVGGHDGATTVTVRVQTATGIQTASTKFVDWGSDNPYYAVSDIVGGAGNEVIIGTGVYNSVDGWDQLFAVFTSQNGTLQQLPFAELGEDGPDSPYHWPWSVGYSTAVPDGNVDHYGYGRRGLTCEPDGSITTRTAIVDQSATGWETFVTNTRWNGTAFVETRPLDQQTYPAAQTFGPEWSGWHCAGVPTSAP